MTDIVERLRFWQCYIFKWPSGVPTDQRGGTIKGACREAADEIERLNRRVALAEKSIECFESDRVERDAEIERLRAENEQLRKILMQPANIQDFMNAQMHGVDRKD